jgi:hypothetical protein
MAVADNTFFRYASTYFSNSENKGADLDTALSQCDPDTRILFYKAWVEAVVFMARRNMLAGGRKWLDVAAFALHRLLLVSQKTGQEQPDLNSLTQSLKRSYYNEHLSMPQNLLDVDTYLSNHAHVDL